MQFDMEEHGIAPRTVSTRAEFQDSKTRNQNKPAVAPDRHAKHKPRATEWIGDVDDLVVPESQAVGDKYACAFYLCFTVFRQQF